jgi:putative nucleotidyltransferase with HDIG domain
VRLVLLGLVLAAVAAVVMALPLLPDNRVFLDVGEVSPEDVRAPRSITYESALLRSDEQKRAESQVTPVYTRSDPAVARVQLDRARQVLDYLGSVNADQLASGAQKRAWVLAAPELAGLGDEEVEALVTLPEETWYRVQLETLTVIDEAMRRQIREGYLDEAVAGLPSLVSLDISPTEAAVAASLARQFLVPNSFLDPEGTAAARAAAQAAVPPVLRSYGAGEIIVREGQRVTALDVEALDELGLRQPQAEVLDTVAAGGLAVLGTGLLLFYLSRFQPEALWDGQQLILLVGLSSLFLLIAGVMVPGGSILRYLAPTPALAMLLTAAVGPHAGAATSVYAGIVLGMTVNGSLEMVAYTALGGLVAALSLGKVERIRELFLSGSFVAVVHLIVIAVFGIREVTGQPGELLASGLSGIANGGVSASLALGVLFLVGPLFDVVTTMRLIELSRPDQPLLQRMLREAPGTYHHSLMVANLAEHAAERMGANALLARVGAYYHDIGKLARPYFFTENQADDINPMDEMDPYTSAQVVISHVTDGLKLARRFRLPRKVRDFIPGHHGTNWISFFYRKAVEQAGDAALVDEQDFRYRGPKPRTKEVALVMLADPVEAAARARRPSTPEELADLIDKIVARRVDDGQLDESELTIRDLSTARQAFHSVLKGMYHPRMQYPEPIQQAAAADAASEEPAPDAGV